MRSPSIKVWLWAILLGIPGLILLGCTGYLETVFLLVIGWARYLDRVWPKIYVRWDLVVSTIVYAIALIVGSHFFLRWLYREAGGDRHRRVWRWRWTLSGFAIIALMFVAGTAAVGIVHQTTWMLKSDRPMYQRRYSKTDAMKCANNLRQIGLALAQYAQNNGGYYPDDFRPLILSEELTADVFICPARDDDIIPARSATQRAEDLQKPGHCSYIYFGKGLVVPVKSTRVLAIEPMENHSRTGLNVLFADARVEWLEGVEADNMMRDLGFEKIPSDLKR